MKLAERVNRIKASPTLAITEKANALKKEGRDIIGFGAGEPDFDTPVNIKNAGIKAIEDGFTKYTPVGGTDELKDAIIDKLKMDNQLTYSRSQVVVSCGAKHTLYNLSQALFEKGDEVIIPSPYWVSYPAFVLLADATPVILETKEQDGFKVRPDQLEGVITKNTKAIILNSPSNPTGAVYAFEELKALADIIAGSNILAISDDIYEKIIFDGVPFFNIANMRENLKDLTVVVNGVSKTYAMTGWRIGYAAGPEDIIAAVSKIQSQNTSNPTSISQKATIEALRGNQDDPRKMVEEYRERRNCIVEMLNTIEGITCVKPQGTFYAFPNVSKLYGVSYNGGTISNSVDFAEYLLDEANVAVVPGSAFGSDDHIRLSYATSMENIRKGIERIKTAIDNLKR
ncbi:MAG: pyridoxal phosphate-dependent aminotransferase [Deltaproteobacteria bacterium]|nr:pyridoxal phosphate-dependent aminotransferase [Deltaproteobacteria bacterium]